MIVKEYHHGITPPSFIVILGWIIFGALLMVSGMFGHGWEFFPSIESVPEIIEFLTGLFIALGAGGMLAASREKATIRQAFKKEYAGLILSMAGWITYATAALFANPVAVGPWLIGLTFVVAAGLRLQGTFSYEKRLRKSRSDG